MRTNILAIMSLCTVQSVLAADPSTTVEYLRCEYQVNPLVIDVTQSANSDSY